MLKCIRFRHWDLDHWTLFRVLRIIKTIRIILPPLANSVNPCYNFINNQLIKHIPLVLRSPPKADEAGHIFLSFLA